MTGVRRYLEFAGLFFGLVALVPFVLGMVTALDGFEFLALLILGLLSALVALAIGAVVFLYHGVRCAKQASDPLHRLVAVLASPVLTVAVLFAMLPLAAFGHYLGRLANPVDESPRYSSAPPIVVEPAPPSIAQ